MASDGRSFASATGGPCARLRCDSGSRPRVIRSMAARARRSSAPSEDSAAKLAAAARRWRRCHPVQRAAGRDAGAKGRIFRLQDFQELAQHTGDGGFQEAEGDMQLWRIARLLRSFMHDTAQQIKRITWVQDKRMRRAGGALLIGPRCGAARQRKRDAIPNAPGFGTRYLLDQHIMRARMHAEALRAGRRQVDVGLDGVQENLLQAPA